MCDSVFVKEGRNAPPDCIAKAHLAAVSSLNYIGTTNLKPLIQIGSSVPVRGAPNPKAFLRGED
jgi:hypothetical protein